jgi:hypothetical protein
MGQTGMVYIQRVILLFFGSPAARLDFFGGPVALRRQVALALLLSEQMNSIYDMGEVPSRKNSVCAKNIKMWFKGVI